MQYPIIHINHGHEKRFTQGFPWVYSNEIAVNPSLKEFIPGQLVEIQARNLPVAIGFYNRHSLIAVRALTRIPTETIDAAFLVKRITEALLRRQIFYKEPFYRLIHAEADGLPGLIIDRFNDVLILQINTAGMEQLLTFILSALQQTLAPTTIYIQRDSKNRITEGLSLQEPEVLGQAIDTLKVIENGVTYFIDLANGQKTGWFYDHRANRELIASLAANKTVIDYFCYSGGFALQAAHQGAKKVVGVDRAESVIRNGQNSALQNGLQDKCTFVTADVFQDLEERRTKGQRFDIVVLDPPAFVKAKKDLAVGLKGYEKLMRAAIPLVAEHGLFLIASCSYHVKEADLQQVLQRALSKTGRTASIVKRLGAGFDHPLHPHLEESEYLKGFLLSFSA